MKLEVTRLQSLPKPIKMAKSAVEWVFRAIDHPLAVVDYKIRLRVAEAAEGCEHEAGQEYWMNIRDIRKLCPAAFHALYPFYGIKDEDKALEYVHCPDHEGILFRLEGKP